MSELQACLSLSSLFRDLDPGLLSNLAASARRIELAGGSILFKHGDDGDALYVVATGRLRASVMDDDGVEVVLGDVGRGEVVGEFALITGEPRSATVRAVRDSVLIRVGKQDVECLMDRYPRAMLDLARLIVMRLHTQGHSRSRDALRSTRTLALVPAHPSAPPLADLAAELVKSLGGSEVVRVLDAAAVESALGAGYAETLFGQSEQNARLLNWLNELEAQFRFLIYQADMQMSPWTRRCIRQADRILLVSDAGQPAANDESIEYIKSDLVQAPVETVHIHRGNRPEPCKALDWRDLCGALAHYHLTQPPEIPVARMARHLTGAATGVVFGGGGARGFAHLGLLRALDALGCPIDMTGGTSIGALFSALVAQGKSVNEIREILIEMFITNNYLNDYSFARLSLIKGKKFRDRLDKLFGDQRIEDLPIPYFCVSTNLTRGAAVVHDRGRIKDWVASSMTIPGIGPPVVWQGDLLVDGGLLNNVPTDVMQALGRGDVIASDVSNAVELRIEGVDSTEPLDLLNFRTLAKGFNLTSIMFRAATLVDVDQVRARRASADLYLRMPVQGVGTFDWEEAQALEQQAYDYASVELEKFFSKATGDQAELRPAIG
jgi:NTE family protein